MSVVIKMDMPKSCGMCECSGTGVCREWMKVDRRDMGSKRADTCPILCELPKKHGRLIDVSKLLTITDIKEDGTESTYIPYSEIEEALTIIEAEGEHENSI